MRGDRLGIGTLLRRPQKSTIAKSFESAKEKYFRKNREKKIIALGLGIPLLLSFVYFYGIGRNRYFVKSEVVVRKPQDSSPAGLNIGTLIGGGNQSSLEDARYLRTYLESPQVLKDLENQFDFRQAYSKKGLDLFAGLSNNASREIAHNFYRRQVSVQLDENSGVIRVTSLGFDPTDATTLNLFLLKQAEKFVNDLNQEIYKKQLGFAENQVTENLEKVKLASETLQKFQRSQEVLSASSEAQVAGSLIAALESELAKQKVQLAILRRRFVDPQAPEIRQVEDQIQGLTKQIQQERSASVSPIGRNLPAESAKLAGLESDLKFKSELYKASLTAAETTRVDSLRQARFLAVLAEPLKPDDPWQYWRHKGFLTTAAILLVGFGLTKFFLGMADSHRN